MNRKLSQLTRLGLISMVDPDPDGGGDDDKAPLPGPHVGQDPAATFTQERVNQIATAQHEKGAREAKRKAEEELAEKLGGRTLEDLIAAADRVKAADDEKKTEAEKALEAATATKVAADADRATARQELYSTRLSGALTKAGMDDKIQATVIVPGLSSESTAEDIEAAVVKLKEDVPSLFGTPKLTPVASADPRPGGAARVVANGEASEGVSMFDKMFGDKKS